MKIIKLIIPSIIAILLGNSCQQQDIDIFSGSVPIKITASYLQTKVSYAESSNMELQPGWEIDDEVLGFDNNGKSYTLTVSDIDANGVATLEGDGPANCTLHLIYLNGAEASDIQNDGSIEIDYSSQCGDGSMPAVMVADGEVIEGTGSFQFYNAGAVVAINATKGIPQGNTITKVSIHGDNLSYAIVNLNDDKKLQLTAVTKKGDTITTDDSFSSVTVADAEGMLDKPILIALPAGAIVSDVTVDTDNHSYFFAISKSYELSANQYSYLTWQKFEMVDPRIVDLGLSVKWANMNVGATESHEPGWLFTWGNIEGYIPSYYEEYEDYFTIEGYYPAEGGDLVEWIFYEDYYLTPGGQLELEERNIPVDAEYDAARAHWGGTWRIPTIKEYLELLTYCTCEETDNYNGTGIRGAIFTSTINGNSIFLPRNFKINSFGNGALYMASDYYYYYSSWCLNLPMDGAETHSFMPMDEQNIRPVCD